MKRFFLVLTCLSLFLSSCETGQEKEGDDGNDNGGGGIVVSLRMDRLDIGNAKYLSLTGFSTGRSLMNDSDSQVGLFKIDEQGNVSAVALSCVENADGTMSRERTDIRVIPSDITSLAGIYTLLAGCDFRTETGDFFDMRAYYEPEQQGEMFNLLVRNADGKIFYIPQAANRYVYPLVQPIVEAGSNGTVYLRTFFGSEGSMTEEAALVEFAPQGEDLVIRRINPDGVDVSGQEVWPMDNGTVVVKGSDGGWGYTFLYPNGGFETLSIWDEDNVYLSRTPSGIKGVQLVRRSGSPMSEYVVTLHDYTVGTMAGHNQLSSPVATISSGTDYVTDSDDADSYWISQVSDPLQFKTVYETSDSYLLGNCLVVDKQSHRIRGLDRDLSTHVIIPTEDNVYKNRSWRIFDATDGVDYGAAWFDVETMEYGEIHFDFSQVGSFLERSRLVNIPEGEVTIMGVRNSDGKQVICRANLETNTVWYTVAESDLPIVTLIPLN